MGRLVSIVLFVGVIWTAVEVYNHGVQGAFGGALAGLIGEANASSAESTLSTPQRAGRAVQRAHEKQQQRYDDLLGE